jgi:hypothetical protein
LIKISRVQGAFVAAVLVGSMALRIYRINYIFETRPRIRNEALGFVEEINSHGETIFVSTRDVFFDHMLSFGSTATIVAMIAGFLLYNWLRKKSQSNKKIE